MLRLRPLSDVDEDQARLAHEELAREGFPFLLDWDPAQPWSHYVRLLRRHHCGIDLRPGWVPGTFLAAVVGVDLVGRVSVRHTLNAYLAEVGGHIGYGVRPAYRGRGYATEILRQALIVARAEGVDRVLVTCDDTNAASAGAITRCGGVLEDVHVDAGGRPTRRYWID
jgi:predicted acetyltransferase